MIAIVAASQSNLVNFKLSKKKTSILLDIIVCFLGGIFFAILTELILTGGSNYGRFDIGRDILNWHDWSIRSRGTNSISKLDEFIFGFIVTYVIIWIQRSYKKL